MERCISPEESEDLALHISRDDLAQTFLFADDDYYIIHFVLAQSVNRESAAEKKNFSLFADDIFSTFKEKFEET